MTIIISHLIMEKICISCLSLTPGQLYQLINPSHLHMLYCLMSPLIEDQQNVFDWTNNEGVCQVLNHYTRFKAWIKMTLPMSFETKCAEMRKPAIR